MASQLFFALNTFVTQFFLARHSGVSVHASLPGSMLAIAFMSFFNAALGYAGTVFAMHDGAGRSDRALNAFVQSLYLTLFSLPLLALGCPLARIILSIFNSSPEVYRAEVAYFDILMPNAALTILGSVLAGYFTGRGKTKLVGTITSIGFAINMVLSPVFISGAIGPGGVIGAGIAQTLAHAFPVVAIGIAICRSKDFKERAFSLAPRFFAEETLEIIRLGVPNGLRVLLEIGVFFVFTALVAELPSSAAIASTIVFALNGIFYSMVQALATTQEILIGRALADGERRANFTKSATFITLFLSLLYAAVFLASPDFWFDIFTCSNPNAMREDVRIAGRALLVIAAIKSPVEFLSLVLQGTLRGMGKTAAVLKTLSIVSFGVWIPLYLIVRICRPDVNLYWMTMIVSCLVSCLILYRQIRSAGK